MANGTALRTAIRDPLLKSSAFLFLASAATAVLGFAFWAIAARLYPSDDIGVASALLSAISLLSYLSLIGLNNLIIVRNAELGHTRLFATAFATVGVLGLLGGALYVVGVRFVSAPLGEAVSGPLMIACFALASWGAAVNVLTDSVFVARNAAHYNLWLNSFLQGGVRLTCLVLAAGLGAAGLVFSTGVAVAVTAVASVLVIGRVFAIPVWSRPRREEIAGAGQFVAGTYVSSLLNTVPLIVIPLLLIRQAGPAGNAHYFVAFQIANLLYASSDAVGQSVFAQATDVAARRPLLVRSALTLAAVTAVGVLGALLASRPLLTIFGAEYVEHSLDPLRALLAASAAVAVNVWAGFVLRLYRRVGWLVLSNLVYLAVTVGLTALWAGNGLLWVALAWALGHLSAAVIALLGMAPELRRAVTAPPSPARPARLG